MTAKFGITNLCVFTQTYICIKLVYPIFPLSLLEGYKRILCHVYALDTVGQEKGKPLTSQRGAGAEREGFISVKGEQLSDLFVYFMGIQIHLIVSQKIATKHTSSEININKATARIFTKPASYPSERNNRLKRKK